MAALNINLQGYVDAMIEDISKTKAQRAAEDQVAATLLDRSVSIISKWAEESETTKHPKVKELLGKLVDQAAESVGKSL